MLTLLSGCARNQIEITKEDALEIAIDETLQIDAEEIDSDVKENGDAFEVHLSSKAGNYTFLISKNGLIESRKFEQKAAIEKKEKEEVKQIEYTNEQKKAIENVLNNLGVLESDVETMKIEDDANSGYKITMTLKNGKIAITTTDGAGQVLSTAFQ